MKKKCQVPDCGYVVGNNGPEASTAKKEADDLSLHIDMWHSIVQNCSEMMKDAEILAWAEK